MGWAIERKREKERKGRKNEKKRARARARACSEEVVELLEKRGEEKPERRREWTTAKAVSNEGREI